VTPRDSRAQLTAAFGLPVQERFVAPGAWNAERVLDALCAWTSEIGRPPFAYEWCSPTESRPRGSERWAREYPRWPSADTVAAYHATWRAALPAAGLPGGRPALELPLGERIEAARRMRATGISVAEIADELGVAESTVGKYLRATPCECGRNWRVRGPRCTQCAVDANAARVRRWDRPSVIDALKRWARIEGRPPASVEWLPGQQRARALGT
jgi:Homeodomain-like domain